MSSDITKRLEPLTIPHPSDERIVDAVFSPVPDFMGVIGDKRSRMFSLRTGQEVELPISKPVTGMAFRPRNELNPSNELALVTGPNAGSVVRLDLELGIGLIDLLMPWANAVAYSHCGRFLTAGATDGTVRVWDLRNLDGAPAETFCARVSQHGITRLAFNATNDVLFIVTARGELLWVDVTKPDMPASAYLRDNDGQPYDWDCYAVATHPLRPLVAFGGIGSKIILSSVDSRKVFTVQTSVGAYVRSMEFLPETGQLLVVGTEVEVFNLYPLSPVLTSYSHPATGRPLAARQYGSSVFVARA